MAIVKNQDLPIDEVEDQLDPPITFIEQYRRTLGEGIDHPKHPAGDETVTFSKRESRPATRSSSEFSKPISREEWRDEFKDCLECWEKQYDTEEDLNECTNYGSRQYVKPWSYVPGAKNTYFNQFMSECLLWAKENPGVPMEKCDEETIPPGSPGIAIVYDSLIMGCGEEQSLSVDPAEPGCPPYEWQVSGGGDLSTYEGAGVTYSAPESNSNCTVKPVITVTDKWGKEATVSLAVNCYTGNEIAFYQPTCFDESQSGSWCQMKDGGGWNWHVLWAWSSKLNHYRCDSIYLGQSYVNNHFSCITHGGITGPCGPLMGMKPSPNDCSEDGPLGCGVKEEGYNCYALIPGEEAVCLGEGEVFDNRTEGMLGQGCCPINPVTGVPF
jgi:hypothetical protein